ncbi:ABC transporter permease [Pseudotenacibaculum sp. MALMAid0570]|mgnify:CR=1 FL=1|uniref:ABC transporter permease n=1 Tax=Pseudotenacibaculum sp. MALMAid0570 TaxID=3143938 RepID=UPI0032DF3378
MKEDKWIIEITPKSNLLDFNFKEVWKYRDLLMLFVKRDVITLYKQTILGPLWYLIQPLLTSVILTLIFNNVAGIVPEKGINPFLFNLAGVTTWNYFKECLTATSDTFKKNEQIFGKVYFPRIIMPLSIVISNLLKFGIQFGIFIAFYLYYAFIKGDQVAPDTTYVFFYPLIILFMGMLGLGLGMIISSMVTKYRDLSFLVAFGVQLLMYISAVVFSIGLAKEKLPDYAWLVEYNPLAYLIETSRLMLIGSGEVTQFGLIYTGSFCIVTLLIGILIFNKTEKSFIDTI